jgi:hypothetical protein
VVVDLYSDRNASRAFLFAMMAMHIGHLRFMSQTIVLIIIMPQTNVVAHYTQGPHRSIRVGEEPLQPAPHFILSWYYKSTVFSPVTLTHTICT